LLDTPYFHQVNSSADNHAVYQATTSRFSAACGLHAFNYHGGPSVTLICPNLSQK
jgi:hypothetical protein